MTKKESQNGSTMGISHYTINEKVSKTRLKNIRGAFTAAERLNGGNILLIDDIYTTGATLNQAAATLKKAGAQRVYFLVIAIGSET